MAAVRDHRRGSDDATSRGQIILVGGLALAVTLLVLAVVLNSAIYTENLATRGRGTAPTDVVDLRGDVEGGIGAVVEHANRANGGADYGTLQSAYDAALDDWGSMAARHAAVDGRSVSVSRSGEMEGTRIVNASPGTPFTPRTDPTTVDAFGNRGESYATPNWLVATDVRVRSFVLDDVALSSLASSTPGDPKGSGAFFVEVRDAADADAWRVAVYEDGGSLAVTVYDADAGSVVGTCSTGEPTALVDLTGGALNARPCDALDFLGDVTGLADVYYVNADDVAGTYELTVDRAGHGAGGTLKDAVDAANYGSQCAGPTYYDDPATGSPSAAAGLYSATVDLRYDDRSLTYDAAVRTAPGEPGEAATAPVLSSLTVTDTSVAGTEAGFDVAWTVADPDGDTVDVTVVLADLVDGTSTTRTYTGDGSDSFTEPGDDGHTYEITVTVDDGTTSRSVTETHLADGDQTGCAP